jgi:hypothetical protein
VTLYGADPTGVNDSTTAINTAIGKCPNPTPSGALGCTVFFPPGSYAVSGNGLTVAQPGVRLLGSGAVSATASPPAGASEIVSNLTSGNVLSVTGGGTANINGFSMSNLGFRAGTPSTSTSGAAILLRDAQYFSIDNVSCEGFVNGTCIELQGDQITTEQGTTDVYTQFGSIEDFFAQAKYGISTAQITGEYPYVSEVTILGGNISCDSSGVLLGSVGVDLDATNGTGGTGTNGQDGEIQIFGMAVNDCATGFRLVNAGAIHLVGKAECDHGYEGSCTTGLLMDNPSGTSLTNGNVITLQASKIVTGIQINDTNTRTYPVRNQIVGGTFLSDNQTTYSDICINSNSLPTTLVLVAATPDTGPCPTMPVGLVLVAGSQFPAVAPTSTATGSGVGIANGTAVVTWSAGSGVPTNGSCTVGSLYSNTSGTGNALYVCTSAGIWTGLTVP